MIRLALRNLARNRWRSGLTFGGVAAAVVALAWTQGLIEAIVNNTVAGITSVQMGDLSIETKAHAHDGSMYDTLPGSDQLLARVRGVPGVRAVAPRLLAFGLVGREARSQSALFIGIDPSAEAAASSVPKAVVDGGWLPQGGFAGAAGRPVVLGEGLAKLLAARVGDELVALLQAADSSMGDDRLRVVGVARTGTSALDRHAAWMRQDDLGYLAALEGQAHTLMVRLERGADLERTAVALRAGLAGVPGPELVVRTWRELAPDMRQLIQLMDATVGLIYGLVFFVAALGILNAQRMSGRSRRSSSCSRIRDPPTAREPGGTTPRRPSRWALTRGQEWTGAGVPGPLVKARSACWRRGHRSQCRGVQSVSRQDSHAWSGGGRS